MGDSEITDVGFDALQPLFSTCFDMLSRLEFEELIQNMSDQMDRLPSEGKTPIRFCLHGLNDEPVAQHTPFEHRSDSGTDAQIGSANAHIRQNVDRTRLIQGSCADCPYGSQPETFLVSPVFRADQQFGILCARASEKESDDAVEILAQSLFAIAASIATEKSDSIGVQAARKAETQLLNMRKKVAADLHDTVAQTLCFLRLKLDELSATLDVVDEAKREPHAVLLDEMKAGVDQVYAAVRTLLHDLYHGGAVLSELDEEVVALTNQFSDALGQPIELKIDSLREVALDEVTRTHVIHILHEALANVRRHAQAKQVKLSANRETDAIEFVVKDDGIGFSIAEIDWSEHFGLNIMRARAERCGGTVTIHSRPGEGAKVVVRLPTNTKLG